MHLDSLTRNSNGGVSTAKQILLICSPRIERTTVRADNQRTLCAGRSALTRRFDVNVELLRHTVPTKPLGKRLSRSGRLSFAIIPYQTQHKP